MASVARIIAALTERSGLRWLSGGPTIWISSSRPFKSGSADKQLAPNRAIEQEVLRQVSRSE